MTISDMSFFEGATYNTSTSSAGDSYGAVYPYWDKNSITMCDCDIGFFGPDCSLSKLILFDFIPVFMFINLFDFFSRNVSKGR